MDLARILAVAPAESEVDWLVGKALKTCASYGVSCVSAANAEKLVLVLEGMASDVFLAYAAIEEAIGHSVVEIIWEGPARKLLLESYSGRFFDARDLEDAVDWTEMQPSKVLLTLKQLADSRASESTSIAA